MCNVSAYFIKKIYESNEMYDTLFYTFLKYTLF